MTNKFLLNRSGMSPEVTCRKGRHAIESIVSRLCLASLICLCMLTVGSRNVWGAEEVIYTLTPYNTGTDGTSTGYAGATDASCEDEDADITITWNVTGNTNMVPWRIGGKGGKGTTSTYDRVIYSKNAISNNVTKIVITHGAASSITVNSMTVIVSTAQNGGGTVTSTLTPTFAANGDVTINRPAGKDWSGKYYKINYNVSITGDKNKFLEFSQAEFYAETGSSCSAPAAPTISGTASYTAGETITLTASHDGSNHSASTTYTWYKGADWATARAASPVQASATGSSGYTFTKTAVVGDAGTYWCEASNGSGCESHNATGKTITVSAACATPPTVSASSNGTFF